MKAKKRLSSKKRAAGKSRSSSARDQLLRDHVLFLLKGGGAHITFDAAIGNWPVSLRGSRIAKFPHSAWMLLEHLRLAQLDILEFSRNPKYAAKAWPDDYWPASEVPPSEEAWTASVASFKKDLRKIERMVADRSVDLYARIPWGDGQTILREALLTADHNAYHVGQLMTLRKSLGI